jgi:ubiquinone/menaquinone biosynthesis C-methylase UbiE
MQTSSEIQARVDRELRAHTEDDVLAESYKLKDRFAHIWTFPSRRRFMQRIEGYLQNLEGKRLLDYGCGRGAASLTYLERGAQVDGIDISPVYIEDAARQAEAAGFPEERYAFHVMDAHKLEFPDATFDFVVGYGILHHLDAEVALEEIHRVLRPGGRVLLQEPLADNPLLRAFRLVTPSARTEDEAPFTGKDLKRLTQGGEWDTDLAYCGIVEAPVAMLTSVLMPSKPDNALLRGADAIERRLHDKGLLEAWNQYVLFDMTKA